MKNHSEYLYQMYLTLCNTENELMNNCRRFMRESLEKQNNVKHFEGTLPTIVYKNETENVLSVQRVPKSGLFIVTPKHRIKVRFGCGISPIDIICLTNAVEDNNK